MGVEVGGLIDVERSFAPFKTNKIWPSDLLILRHDLIFPDKSLEPTGYPLFALTRAPVVIPKSGRVRLQVTLELRLLFESCEFFIEVVAKCVPAVSAMRARESYRHCSCVQKESAGFLIQTHLALRVNLTEPFNFPCSTAPVEGESNRETIEQA